jgi:hypothetical protein
LFFAVEVFTGEEGRTYGLRRGDASPDLRRWFLKRCGAR